MSLPVDLTGKKFGRLSAINRAGSDSTGVAMWRFRCDCGNEIVARSNLVRRGHTQSCGCLQKERAANSASIVSVRHGHTKSGNFSGAYKSWAAMLARCQTPSSGAYPEYGGIGISVCERWQSFENFYDDMGDRPPGKTLDRFPDPHGDYEPGNVRWATNTEQRRNLRNNVLIECRGRKLTAGAWSEISGVLAKTISARIRSGWPSEKAIFQAPRKNFDRVMTCLMGSIAATGAKANALLREPV